MANKSQFAVEDVAPTPRGWHVRTKGTPAGDRLRLAFPPGRRKRGAGKLVQILHRNPVRYGVFQLPNGEWEIKDNFTGHVLETVKTKAAAVKAVARLAKKGANMNPKAAPAVAFQDTEIDTWFERDRAHVALRNTLTDETIIEWWDEEVNEAIEDGFLKPRDYHGSAYEYAVYLGFIRDPSGRNPRRRNVTAYGSPVRTRHSQQEWYESASGDARKRAAQLRKLGFRVSVSSMGSQVTPVGTVKMTLLTIHDAGDREIPPPERVERMNPEVAPRGRRSYGETSAFVEVTFTADEVEAFRRRWPASGLPDDEAITFEFDRRNGDLVDMTPSDLEERGADGAAVVALADDGLRAAVEAGEVDAQVLTWRGLNPAGRRSNAAVKISVKRRGYAPLWQVWAYTPSEAERLIKKGFTHSGIVQVNDEPFDAEQEALKAANAALKGAGLNPGGRGEWEVIVGNIGSVYAGKSGKEAKRKFAEYVRQSKSGRGRAAGEDVTLLRDGEPVKEHTGSRFD